MSKIKTNLMLPLNRIFGYTLIALGLSAFIAFSPIWGGWITLSLILAFWTKDDDQKFLTSILFLTILGPLGRILSPGTFLGSLWSFDFLILFGFLLRINRYLPIRIGRDVMHCVSTPAWFTIFSVIGLIGSLFVFPLPIVLKGALYTIRWLGYYMVIGGIREKRAIRGKIGIIGLTLAILGFLQLWLLPNISQNLVREFAFDPHVGRLFATWFDPNFLGGFLVMAALLSLEGKPFDFAQGKGIKGILIGIIGLAIILTFSRSSYLALMIGVLVYLGFKSPKLITVLITLVMAITTFITPVRQRVIGAIHLDITARQRISNYQTAWSVIKINPIIGVGYNLYNQASQSVGVRYKKVDMPYLPASGGSDSSMLTIWTTTGIGGLLVYLLLFWKIYKLGSVAEKSAISALFIHSLFVNSLLLPPFMLVFWLLYDFNKKHNS